MANVSFTGGVYYGSASQSSGSYVTTTCSFSVTVPAGTNFMWVYLRARGGGGAYISAGPTFNGVAVPKWNQTLTDINGIYYYNNPPIGTYTLSASMYANRGAINMITQCFGGVNPASSAYGWTSGTLGNVPFTTAAISAVAGSFAMLWEVGGTPQGNNLALSSPGVLDYQLATGYTDASNSSQSIYQAVGHKDTTAGGSNTFTVSAQTNQYGSPYYIFGLNPLRAFSQNVIWFM